MSSYHLEPYKPASVKPEWKWPAFFVEEGQPPPLKEMESEAELRGMPSLGNRQAMRRCPACLYGVPIRFTHCTRCNSRLPKSASLVKREAVDQNKSTLGWEGALDPENSGEGAELPQKTAIRTSGRRRVVPNMYQRGASQADLDEAEILSDPEESPKTYTYNQGRPSNLSLSSGRTSRKKCPGCGELNPGNYKVCQECEYVFPQRQVKAFRGSQMDMMYSSGVPERPLMSFEPEREEDGHRKIDRIIARRRIGSDTGSVQTGRGNSFVPTQSTSILLQFSHRKHDHDAPKTRYDYEYLVKYKGMSFKRLEWLSATDLESQGKASRNLLNRFIKKEESKGEDSDDERNEEYFDPLYCEAERVLDSKEFDVEVEYTEHDMANLLAQEEAEDQAVVKAAAANVAAPTSLHNNSSLPTFNAPRTLSHQPLVGASSSTRDSGSSPPPPVLENGSAAVPTSVDLSSPGSSSPSPLLEDGGVDESNIQVTTSSKSKEDPIWRPFTRCMHVLEKLEENTWCDIFREPVELEDFPDYTSIVDLPMDLGTIREKLESKSYRRNAPDDFARDVRQVWHNCKVYNKHGSSIWYTADYLSKHFERLYATWVMAFQDKSIPYDDPQGQPWELSCRKCLLDNRPDDIILCDSCDAEYHTFCLTPKLSKVPDELWQCPRCQFRLAQGERLHSHALEEAARARADNADKTHHIVRVKKYLVKWRGLSYADCTWETQEEINDDEVIAKFHILNDEPPQEPPLTKEEIAYELNPANRVVIPAMLDPNSNAQINAQIYSQARAWHFIRHGLTPTEELLKETGALTLSYAACKSKGKDDVKIEGEIMTLMWDMLSCVSQGLKYSAEYGHLLPMEFEETIPKVNDSLYLNVAEHGSFVRVESFRLLPDGSPAPVSNSLIRPGNFIVSVNGVECDGLSFDDIVFLLTDSPPFVTLRLSNNIVQRAAVRDHIQKYRAQERQLPQPGMSPMLQHQRLVQWMNSLGIPEDEVGPVSDSDDDEANVVVKSTENTVPALGSMHRFMVAVCEAQSPPDPEEWKGDIYRCANHRHVPQVSAITPYPTDTRRKPIEQLDEATGRVLNVWDSLTSASKATGIHISCLSQAANGHTSLAGNRMYRYCHVSYEEAVRNWIASSGGMQGVMATQAQITTEPPPPPPTANAAILPVNAESAAAVEPEPSGKEEEEQQSVASMDDLDEDKDEVEVKGFGDWRSRLPVKGASYNGNKLRDYQVEGVRWMLACWYRRRGCILADEMGLGKTVQVTAVLEHLHRVENLRGPFLIVVPLSTIEHWRREIETWTDMNLCVYHDISGGSHLREVIREYEWYYKCRSRRVLKFQVLVTTYDDLIRDTEELSEIPWRSVVVDEAHRLRNRNSKLLECLMTTMQLGMSSYDFQHRILMTGTPLQNNVEELWSLMNFVEPNNFSSRENFMDRYKDMETENQVRSLQKKIAPHMLRRVKEDVAHDIPPKEETMVDVELTMLQKRYYRAIFEKNHAILFQVGGGSARTMPSLMNIQMELRKCCNHPFLVRGVEDHEVDTMVEDMMKEAGKGMLSEKEVARARLERGLVQSSGKMMLLDKLLPKLRSEGHKVLIFSQFIMMLDMLAEYCRLRGYPHETLDGRVLGNERQKAIDRFNVDSDSFVFLLSTRAGGVGINLTAADTCIIFDSDWNPQNDIQAMARCHRIGQTKDVKVYRLVSRRTFESEMFVRASKKLGLEQAVLGSHDDKEHKLSTMEMEKLLREGAYALMEDGEQAMEEFNEMDIEKILEQRSHKIISDVEPKDKKTAEWLSNKADDVENDNADEKKQKRKKASFRKSKFQSESTSEDLDVNDPNFWQKVLPDLVTPAILMSRLDEGKLEPSKSAVKNYFKDVEKMFSNMLAQQERGTLSNDERNRTVNLLVHISVKTDIFSPQQLNSATIMAQRLQGSRLRQSVRVPDAMNDGSMPPPHDGGGSSRSKRCGVGSKDRDRRLDDIDGWGPSAKKRARKSVVPPARDLNMDICAMCENGGEIMMCDGPCNRSFHPECLEMDEVPAGEEWLCPDCSAWVYTCLLCGETGAVKGGPNAEEDNDDEEFVTKCAVISCGRFYHNTCAQMDDRVRRIKDRKGVKSFKCPQHYCRICKKSAAELHRQQPVVKCTRCPNAYHELCISGLPASEKHHSYLRKGKMMVCCDHELDDREKADLAVQQLRREAVIEAEGEEEESIEGRKEGGSGDGTRKSLKGRVKPAVAPDPQFPETRSFSRRRFKEVCGFCGKNTDSDETPEGRFIRPPFAELINNRETPLFAHRQCVLYTPEAYVRVVDPDSSNWSNSQDALDECEVYYYNVVKAKKRARMLRCAHCGTLGSSIGCHSSACDASFHYGCCLETGWTFGEDPDMRGKVFYCKDHRSEGQKKAVGKKGHKRRNPNGEIVRPSLKGVKSASAPKPKYARGEAKGSAPDPVLKAFEDMAPSIKRFAMVRMIAKLKEEDQDMIFEEAITDEEAPGYSDIIEHPICIQMIEQRVKKGRYADSFRCRGMDGFKEDISIMFANCQHYNQEGSVFWLEAKRLATLLPSLFESTHSEALKYAAIEGASHSGNRESRSVSIRTWDDVEYSVQRRAMTDVLAALASRPDMKAFEKPLVPAKGGNSNNNSSNNGDNNDVEQRSICLQDIRASLANGMYDLEERGAMAFQDDLRLMFNNCIEQYPRGSSMRESAVLFLSGLSRMVKESLKAASKAGRKDRKDSHSKGKSSNNSGGGVSTGRSGKRGGGSTIPSKLTVNSSHLLMTIVREHASQPFKEHVMNTVLTRVSALDPDGIFTDPVTDEQAPDYSSIILEPICIKDMVIQLNESGYREPPEGRGINGFSEDIVRMYDNCKLYNGEGSELWDHADAILGKLPIIFHEAVKNARHLFTDEGNGSSKESSNADDSSRKEKSLKITDAAATATESEKMLLNTWCNMENRERREAMNEITSAICKIAPSSHFEFPHESNGSICWQLIRRRIGKGRYLQRGPMSFIGDIKQALTNVQNWFIGDGVPAEVNRDMASEGLEKLPDIIANAFKLGSRYNCSNTDIDIVDTVQEERKEGED